MATATNGVLRSFAPVITTALAASIALAQSSVQGGEVIFRDATFEELAAVTISSVSKRDEPYFRTSAAVHVVTADDIRRSGALSLPEALRLAPGVEVGMVNSRTAAITVRGFNGTSANKVLPLVDGRSLYSLRFGGTIWDMRELPLDDIAQIEVIGGPAGTTWGANAVNGVINVITKSARQTQGSQLSISTGTFHEGALYARHGFPVGTDGWARVYVSAFRRSESEPVNLPDNHDSWGMVRAGVRYDRERENSHTVVSAEIFDSDADQAPSVGGDAQSHGGHLLVRERRELAEGAWQVQAIYDNFDRDSGGNQSTGETVEVDTLHEFTVGGQHLISWGLNYRLSRLRDAVNSQGFSSSFSPAARNFVQGGVYLQDEWRLPWATATLGVKSEYNDFTGWETMPALRLGSELQPGVFVWASVSRAARIPSRIEHDQSLLFSSPGFLQRTFPSPNLEAEELLATEAGLRWHPQDAWTVDFSVYSHRYRHLVTNESVAVPGGLETTLANRGRGRGEGAEFSISWQPREWWRLQLMGNLLDLDTSVEAASSDTILRNTDTQSPTHQVSVRSSFNFPSHIEADLWWRRVGELPRPNALIPAYSSLDLRLGKQLGRGWEVSIVGQNLLAPSHREFRFFTTQAAVPRSGYIRFDWRR